MLWGPNDETPKPDFGQEEPRDKPEHMRCSITGCRKSVDANDLCFYHRTSCHIDGCHNPNIDGALCQSHWLVKEQELEEFAKSASEDGEVRYSNWRGNLEGLDSVFPILVASKSRRGRDPLIETRDIPSLPRRTSGEKARMQEPQKNLDSMTPREAEFLAATWMKKLGLGPNQVTPSTKDGGIDVDSENWAAQVKFQAQPIGVSAVRQIVGAKQAGQKAIFFSKSEFTSASVDYANQRGVALFVFRPGFIEPRSKSAESLIKRIY